MMMLEDRLRALGDQLELDDVDVVDGVLARLDEQASSRERASSLYWLVRVAAVLIVAVAAVVVTVPSAREAVADWFGLDGVTIERDSGLDVPATADPVSDAADEGFGTVVPDAETDVLVSRFPGSIDTDGLTKTIGDDTEIQRVDVNGSPGLWIDGDPHEVVYQDANGQLIVERFAGNTLLWQDGTTVRRLEGFDVLPAALAYAATLDD